MQALLAERTSRRRAQRLWRIASIIAGIGLGLVGWGWGLAAFLFFQFLVYATYWHSVRQLEQETGVPEGVQVVLLQRHDASQN